MDLLLAPIQRQLHKHGYVVLENYFSESEVRMLLKECNSIFEINKSKCQHEEMEGMSNDFRLFGMEKKSKIISELFAQNPYFKGIANDYMKCDQHTHTTLYTVLRKDENVVSNSGGDWHRDNHFHQFKAILYLNDVDADHGCFQFVTNTRENHIGYPQHRGDDSCRFDQKLVDKLVETTDSKVIDITGSAGTVILVDTSFIHRGKPINQGQRLVLTNYYFEGDQISEEFLNDIKDYIV